MPSAAKATRATIIPCLRYDDAPAAIDWLCKAFGFEKQAVYPNADGSIAHAQLVYGNGMVMLGSTRRDDDGEWGRRMTQPASVGGAETQSPCVIVDDADATYASAKAAGATIAIEIADAEYGGRGFGCLDPEGHLWFFSTYDPWSGPT
jgi:uncharacterized glyoxalase superfamily protein PhnB